MAKQAEAEQQAEQQGEYVPKPSGTQPSQAGAQPPSKRPMLRKAVKKDGGDQGEPPSQEESEFMHVANMMARELGRLREDFEKDRAVRQPAPKVRKPLLTLAGKMLVAALIILGSIASAAQVVAWRTAAWDVMLSVVGFGLFILVYDWLKARFREIEEMRAEEAEEAEMPIPKARTPNPVLFNRRVI